MIPGPEGNIEVAYDRRSAKQALKVLGHSGPRFHFGIPQKKVTIDDIANNLMHEAPLILNPETARAAAVDLIDHASSEPGRTFPLLGTFSSLYEPRLKKVDDTHYQLAYDWFDIIDDC